MMSSAEFIHDTSKRRSIYIILILWWMLPYESAMLGIGKRRLVFDRLQDWCIYN